MLVATAALAAVLGVAWADGVAVTDRLRPEYDAKGIPLGAFRLFPTLDIGVAVTNNVFQSNANTKSDAGLGVAPGARLTSEWSSHLLEFFGRLNAIHYADNSSENQTNWSFGAEGRLDIQRGSALFAGLSKSRAHEGRSSPNSPGNIAEPVAFELMNTHASVVVQPNRLRFFAGIEHNRYDYDRTPLNGGGSLSNRDRDRDDLRIRARVSLEIDDGYLGFVEAAFDRRDFDLNLDRTGVNRDSDGSSLNVGVEFKLVEFLQGELFVGYVDRQFGAPLQDFSGFNYGTSLKWSLTPLTTLRLNAARLLNDTTVSGASLVSDRSIGFGIDHELLRNVILRADLAFVDSAYEGATRRDDGFEGRLRATYLIDDNLSATAAYERLERDSNVPGGDFSEDRVNVGFRLQL